MARIRSIKPAFFVNEQLAELSYGDRLLFIGLWTQADKCGRFEDRPMRLKAALFPYDDFNVVDGLGRLANAGLIVKYEGDGQALIQIPTWDKHQRPHKSEQDSELPGLPKKDGELPEAQRLEALREAESGSGKGTDPSSLRSGFDWFWMCYPRKVGKDAAWAVWQRLKPNDELVNAMISAIDKQSRSPQWMKEAGQFIPHPRTWLGQGRWSDEIPQVGFKPSAPVTRFAQLGGREAQPPSEAQAAVRARLAEEWGQK